MLDLRVAVVLVAVCSDGGPVRPEHVDVVAKHRLGGHGGAGGGDGGGGVLGGSSCPGSLGGGGDGDGGDGGGGDGSGGRGDGGGGDFGDGGGGDGGGGDGSAAPAAAATALAAAPARAASAARRRRWRRRRRGRRWRRRRGRRWRRRRCRRRRRRVGVAGVTWVVLRQCAPVVSITIILAARVQPAEHAAGRTFDVRILARRPVAGVDGAPHFLARGAAQLLAGAEHRRGSEAARLGLRLERSRARRGAPS